MKTKKWLGFDFDRDGWSDFHENRNDGFVKFARDFKSDLKSMLKNTDWEVDTFKGKWFVISGFLYNKSKNLWVYFSVSDVRHWQDAWSDNVLVRTADNNKDFTGHYNEYTKFLDIVEYLNRK